MDIHESLGEDIRQSLGEDIPVGWTWLGSPQLSRDNVESTFQDSPELNVWGSLELLDGDIHESLATDILWLLDIQACHQWVCIEAYLFVGSMVSFHQGMLELYGWGNQLL